MSDTAKKQILFVDDEPHLLSGLRRMLRGKRREWDMHFAGGGDEALQLIESQPIDVIVSDMRMPGIDGAELLKRVSQLSPGTIRIILSGQASEKPVLEVVHYAHQFLAKPCDSAALTATVERSCTLHDLLAEPKLQHLVAQLETLPSIPELFRQLQQEMVKDDPSIQKIGDIIEQDPGMSGKILQMVNSAFFALPRTVTKPVDAVVLLGMETVSNLILAAEIFGQIDPGLYKEFALDRVWKHVNRTATIVKRLARAEGLPTATREAAATAGLLHDIGKLILASETPDMYRKINALSAIDKIPSYRAEYRLLGTTHTEIGAFLLGLWGLPIDVITAIARHHNLQGQIKGEVSATVLLHFADTVEQQLAGTPGAGPNIEALEKLGLGDRLDNWRAIAEKLIDT